jgi:hypothetical protein
MLFNVATPEPPYPLVKWKDGFRTRTADTVIVNTYQNNVLVDPTLNNANALSSGGNIDFWLREGQYDIIDSLTLNLNLTNNGAAAASYPNICQLINYVEIAVNNGANLLSSIDGDYLYCLTSTFTSEDWALKSNMMNTTAQWGNGPSLAVGATQNYYVVLKDIVLNQLKLNMKYLQGDIRVRFNFRPWSTTGAGGGTAPTISGIGIILNQINLDSKDQFEKKALYRNVGNGIPEPIMLRYLDAQRFITSSYSISQNTQYIIPLQNIMGMCSHIYFFLRPSGATGYGLNNFVNIKSFDIVDNNNNSIINYTEGSNFNLYMEYGQFFPRSTLTLYKNLYTYSFNTSPIDSYSMGYQGGFYPFQGYEKLIINSGSIAAGNYDIIAYFVHYKNIVIADGKIDVIGTA